jgi:3-methyladenine DNA glycosylase AlkD
MSMKPKQFVQKIQQALEPHRNPTKAAPMAAYMKNLFPFLGLPRTILVPLEKPLLQEIKPFVNSDFLHQSVLLLWELPEREYQYVAMDLLNQYAKHASYETLEVIEKLATQKSWWDSIDPLSSIVGKMLPQFPEWQDKLDVYSTHENFWLRRVAILYQRAYKDKTDAGQLFHYCQINASKKEFFIRKAIGWALREYSKSNPEAVRKFIGDHKKELSPLSIREGSKYL